MPYYQSNSLNNCMDYFFDECQPSPHNALKDAKCVKRLCENYAEMENYNSFDDLLNDNNQYVHTF